MIKERVWPVRAMYMLIAAALAISLIITAAPALKVSAADDIPDAEWDRVSTPTTEDWVLSPNSTIVDATTVPGGEVAYAIVNFTGQLHLLKSTDSAATWGNVTDALVDALDDDEAITGLLRVACDPEEPDFVAVALALNTSATATYVFLSEDGAATFRNTGDVEDGGVALPNNGVFAFAVAPEEDGMRNIAIGGTNGTDAMLFRCLALGDIGTGWMDATDYDGWDDEGEPTAFTSTAVVNIHIPASWSADNTILVASINGTHVWLQCGTWGTTEGWNADSTVAMDAVLIADPASVSGLTSIASLGPSTAGITTPLDYSGRYTDKRYVWVNVNYYKGAETYGTIFRVKNNSVTPIGWQIEDQTLWLTNVSYLGYVSDGKAIAGVMGTGNDGMTTCCEGVQVYRNDNIVTMDICCYDWEPACKPPTGQGAMLAFYVSEDKAYAIALGPGADTYDEGAWSVSFDDGDVWNQLSLIDTYISYLSDVAVSPDCNKMMLVSVNDGHNCDCDSVWLQAEDLPEAEEYSGKWLRTWCGKLLGSHSPESEWGFLRLAPEETTGDTVYLVDYYTDTVYWNELETLGCWDKGTATVDHIVDLAVKDKETIYALDYDGTVAMSDDYAVGWDPAVDSELDNGFTIAVWGDPDILVGGRDGDVSYSADGGETFTELEDIADSGCVTVAFDSYYDTNNTVYAAIADGSGADNGVYSFVIGESETWKDLRAEPTEDALCCCTSAGGCPDRIEVNFTGLVVDNADGNPMTSADTGGVLYASFYYNNGDNGYEGYLSGVARRLNPAEVTVCPTCVEWDYLIKGLMDYSDPDECPDIGEHFNAIPDALKICGCLTPDTNSKLFAIDSDLYYDMWHPLAEGDDFDGGVWMFEDCYAKKAPDLISPADGATIPSDPCECIPLPFTMKWERLCDACSYDIQIALDEDFNEVMFDSRYMCDTMLDPCCHWTPTAGETPSFPVMMEPYERFLICEFTYYWRVRAADAATDQIIHSWWSESTSFTVAPGPAAGVDLISPEVGATDVAINDIAFTWTSVASADEYDWVLSANSDLSSPIATSEGLTATATAYTGADLDYETPYFWQVTALKEGGVISMSAIGAFTTMAEPPAPVEPVTPETPTWVWVVIAIGAVLVIVVIVLIFRTRRV